MRHKRWLHHLLGAILAAILSISTVGSFISGWDLPVESISTIFLCCVAAAFISAILCWFRHGLILIACLISLLFTKLWQGGAFWDQLQTLSYTLTTHFKGIYGWIILGTPLSDELRLPLLFLGACTASSISCCYCREKRLYSLIPFVFVPFVLCFITTDRVPDAEYIYLFLLTVILLLATDWTRRNHAAHGDRLILRLSLPVAIALALLFLANPQEGYINNAEVLEKTFISWFEQIKEIPEQTVQISPIDTATIESLNLRTVGPKSKRTTYVMEVESDISGIFYLRGRDYDVYTGTGWRSSSDRVEVFPAGSNPDGKITVTTYGIRNVIYVPYYATEEFSLVDGAWENEDRLQSYNFLVTSFISTNAQDPGPVYTVLPADSMEWASELVSELTSDAASEQETIERIRKYVNQSSRYDLSTARMPKDQEDFARWFLEQSDTGYCVHFATAATVLLRSAGIPARYVEGYMVSCEAGETTKVSNHEAHAWVEYYDRSISAWRILESTPPDLTSQDPTEPSSDENRTELETTLPAVIPTEEPPQMQPDSPPSHTSETDPSIPSTTNTEPYAAKPEQPFQIPDWFYTLLQLTLLVAILPIQYRLRRKWKRERWKRGVPNHQAMRRWQETRFASRILRMPYPDELDRLAQKASFSQHQLTSEELECFDFFHIELSNHLKQMRWYKRILLNWLFAISD